MINIFYNPNYIKTEKVWITKSFKYSHLYNTYLDLMYLLNKPVKNSLIFSGPHKRMNNLVKIKTITDSLLIICNIIGLILYSLIASEKILKDIIQKKTITLKF